MDYSKMTDSELVWAYYDEPEPLERSVIARHIKDAELRERLEWRAKVLRQQEEEYD